MKPLGIKHIGPICAHGCCFRQTPATGTNRKLGHNSSRADKKRSRQRDRRIIQEELKP